MKKILFIMIILLTIGCGKEKEEIKTNTEIISNEEEIKEEVYVDTNPIVVGLYKNGNLLTEYHKKFTDKTDISVFSVLFTNDKTVPNKAIKSIWKQYYDKYENIDDYKIGFEIKVDINGQEKVNVMLNPENQHKLDPYLYAYLYDDIHSSGYYSHVTMDKVTDDTIYSSIKLYLHKKTNEITSPITLTVFTYKDDNDFLDGRYRGNSKYTITIYNK